MEKATAGRHRCLAAVAVVGFLVLAPVGAQAQTTPPASPRVVSVDPGDYPAIDVVVVVPGLAASAVPSPADVQVSDASVTAVTKLPADTLDVVLVVDDRRSIGAVTFAQVKEVAAQLATSLDKETHVAVNTVTGLGGFPTDDLAAADLFVRRLTSVSAKAGLTPSTSLVRIGGLLRPGPGRRTHVVLVTSDSVPIGPADDTALRALLAKAGSELSVITLAKQLDPSIVEVVTPGGVATADAGQGIGALTEPIDAMLTSQFQVRLTATRTGSHTLTVRAAGVASTPATFTVDQPGSGPTSSAAAGPATTNGSSTSATAPPAATAATSSDSTTVAAGPSSPATTAAPTVTVASAVTPSAATTTVAAAQATGSRPAPRSRTWLIAMLGVCGVLLGAAAAIVAVRRLGRRSQASPWVEFDTLRVSAGRDDAWRAGRELRLDPNERDVLLALVRRPGHIYSTEDVAAIAWPVRDKVSPRLVSTLMDHLQRTVDGLDDAPLVHAVRGAGYVLSDPADTDDDIASAIRPRPPRYAPPPHRRASRK